ncbi:hypothetical protein H0X91_31445 [Burkholderia sp. 9777_1386]|nr:hypothetical protein [Burkholderia sp. 9777_1386]
MPIQEALLKMSMYVSLVPIVPGPTNTLLLSSGLKVRLRGTWPLIVAEALATRSRLPDGVLPVRARCGPALAL